MPDETLEFFRKRSREVNREIIIFLDHLLRSIYETHIRSNKATRARPLAKTYEDLMCKYGAIKKLLKSSLENILESKLSSHLGYTRHSPLGNNSGNNRNGKTYKTIKTDQGQIDIKIPRDRQSSFDPVVIKKYEK